MVFSSACVILIQCQRVTDRRPDIPTVANTGLCISSYVDGWCLVKRSIFSPFGRHIFGILKNKANLVIGYYLASVAFPLTPKYMTLNGHHTLNSVFCQGEVQGLLIYLYVQSHNNIYWGRMDIVSVNPSTVVVGQLCTAKKLWGVDRIFGVVWRIEFENFVDTLFTVSNCRFIVQIATYFLQIKRNISNSYMDTLCSDTLIRYYNNHHDGT